MIDADKGKKEIPENRDPRDDFQKHSDHTDTEQEAHPRKDRDSGLISFE
jgi:hypothetical protein